MIWDPDPSPVWAQSCNRQETAEQLHFFYCEGGCRYHIKYLAEGGCSAVFVGTQRDWELWFLVLCKRKHFTKILSAANLQLLRSGNDQVSQLDPAVLGSRGNNFFKLHSLIKEKIPQSFFEIFLSLECCSPSEKTGSINHCYLVVPGTGAQRRL